MTCFSHIFHLFLRLQSLTKIDMTNMTAKVQIKNDRINCFGGIFFAIDQFRASRLAKLVNNTLGSKGLNARFKFSDILENMASIFLSGGEVLEDVNFFRQEAFGKNPDYRFCSADTIARDLLLQESQRLFPRHRAAQPAPVLHREPRRQRQCEAGSGGDLGEGVRPTEGQRHQGGQGSNGLRLVQSGGGGVLQPARRFGAHLRHAEQRLRMEAPSFLVHEGKHCVHDTYHPHPQLLRLARRENLRQQGLRSGGHLAGEKVRVPLRACPVPLGVPQPAVAPATVHQPSLRQASFIKRAFLTVSSLPHSLGWGDLCPQLSEMPLRRPRNRTCRPTTPLPRGLEAPAGGYEGVFAEIRR